MKTIKDLELKRLQNQVRLTESELESLAIAYRYVGKESHALKVEESLSRRHLTQDEQNHEDDNELESLIEKIETLSELSDSPDY